MLLFLFILFCRTDKGVIIVNNVWFLGDDHQIRIFNTGDLVEIIGQNERLKVRYENATGELLKGVLINLGSEIAADKLFFFSRGYFDEGEYKKAAALFDVFTNSFGRSKYLAEALYYSGLSYEEIAKDFNTADSIPWIRFNEKNMSWYYTGDAYEKIIPRFPKSLYSSKAAYRLIKIFHMRNSPWDDAIQPIQEELKMWREFILKYRESDEYVLALTEIGYIDRVLYEITGQLNYREDATEIFKSIIKDYPNTVYSAESRIHLYEIEQGENIYKY
jgi:outer membrane protein assembly factor BamD (BamD/ComL family)